MPSKAAPASRELFRVGLPIRTARLSALLATMEPSDEATVRHYNGTLIVEEPTAVLPLDTEAL